MNLSPSNECQSSNSIQTLMIINDPEGSQDSGIRESSKKNTFGEMSLEISQSLAQEDELKPIDLKRNPNLYPQNMEDNNDLVRHISALSFISKYNNDKNNEQMEESSRKLQNCKIPDSKIVFNISPRKPQQKVTRTESDLIDIGNSIKIIHSRSSSESTKQMQEKREESHRQISYVSLSVSSELTQQKENAQPNQTNPEISGHAKSDTVICHSMEESPNSLFNTKWCRQNLDSSLIYEDSRSPGQVTNGQDMISTTELDQIIKMLEDSMQKQSILEENLSCMKEKEKLLVNEVKTLRSTLKKSESENTKLTEKVDDLHKELSLKTRLAMKCSSLERKLKEAEHAVLQINSNLKSSENKRLTLSKQLENKIQESESTAKKLREQFSSATIDLSLRDKSYSIVENEITSDLFQDMNTILTNLIENFKYNDFLVGLTLKEDKKLKEIMNRLQKYQKFNTYSYSFINTFAKIMSIKSTCEKYIQKSNIDKAMNDQARRSSTGKKKAISPKDKNQGKSEKKASSRAGSKKKQSNYLNYKKQLNSYTRNTRIDTSKSLKKYFYSNRSINEASQMDDFDSNIATEKHQGELRYSKPNLRKNVYASLPKKTLNERKASSPANYSVLTDNFVKIEDSLAMKYTSNQQIKPKEDRYSKSPKSSIPAPSSQYHSQGKKSFKSSTKTVKLPVSKSVKNIHENVVPKPTFHPCNVAVKSPRNFTSKVSFKPTAKAYDQMKMAASKIGIPNGNSRKQYLNVTGMFSTRNSMLHTTSARNSGSGARPGPISVRPNY
ncbi:unnamed protein product [Moneuplotes crassus]|uniref:Uncharacterized protein n=1 Tax=Euplotes crassus TaxID=5936 RepID=A0AAD1YBE4_EUPCR|nr:unnamed protein product [Moneuplotes crassus]